MAPTNTAQSHPTTPWRVLIVDDEPDVHSITRIVLRDTVFEGRPVEFVNAYSAAEAQSVLSADSRIAVAILDVVMETDDAGLLLAKWIREDLGNQIIRIILRTGRPGEAPERTVILKYDINDYREKSELTDVRLLTMLVSALRGYRDLNMLELSRRGFAQIAEASGRLFQNRSVPAFVETVLAQLASLISGSENSVVIRTSGVGVSANDQQVVAATGEYQHLVGRNLDTAEGIGELHVLISDAQSQSEPLARGAWFAACFPGARETAIVLAIHTDQNLDKTVRIVLDAFAANVALAYQNLTLVKHIDRAQREMIYLLGNAVETRSRETGNHVRRIAEFAAILGQYLGMSEPEIDELRLLAPLHDIGKISVPDRILNKPGSLTEDEFEIVKRHATDGHDLLKSQSDGMLAIAGEIAYTHHEWWNGEGYPQGLAGSAIPLLGRITALADVFDALSHDRVYKKRWGIDKVYKHIAGESGTHFDPEVVDACKAVRSLFEEVLLKYPD